MLRWLCVAVLLAGCGAKTGAEVDPAAERETPPFDAGFDTFPCRWSLAQPTVVHREEDMTTWRAGAIHATRDEALLLWARVEDVAGARLMLGDPPPVLARFGPEIAPGPMQEAVHGVALSDPTIRFVSMQRRLAGGCDLMAMGEEPPWRSVVDVEPGVGCVLEPQDPGRVDLTLLARDEVRLWSATDLDAPTIRRIAPPSPALRARSVRTGESTWMLFTHDEAGPLSVHRVTDAGIESMPLALGAGLLELAPDRVRGGAVASFREESRWRIVRIPLDGELRAIPLADLDRLGSTPTGQMVANETEAMLPLFDRRVAVVPLDGSAVRFIGPVDGVPQVVLRPGSSGGGLLYSREEEGEQELVFQPLTCNR